MMSQQDFTLTILTDQSPEQVFQAVNNVRGWWSGFFAEEFAGDTEKLGDEFSFRAGGGAHFTKHKLVEVIPNNKVVWLTTDSHFTFVEKPDEWTGTKIIFDISKKDGKTQLVFTHEGLKPEVECYSACAPAWTGYLREKLAAMVGGVVGESKNFTASIIVPQSPAEAFVAIQNFRAWWSEEIEGHSDKLNEEFFYHYKDIHLCKLKLIEAAPGKLLVYLVTENDFNFISDKSEWVGTKLVFNITEESGKTIVKFTHEGLVPEYECYLVCNDAWTGYIKNSLYKLITTGKGEPNPKDKDGFNAELAEKWKLT